MHGFQLFPSKPGSALAEADFSIIRAWNSTPCLVSPANCPIYTTLQLLLLFFFHLTHDHYFRDNSQRYHYTLVLTVTSHLPPKKIYRTMILMLIISTETFAQAKRYTKLKLYGCLNVTYWHPAKKWCSKERMYLAWGGKKNPCLYLH